MNTLRIRGDARHAGSSFRRGVFLRKQNLFVCLLICGIFSTKTTRSRSLNVTGLTNKYYERVSRGPPLTAAAAVDVCSRNMPCQWVLCPWETHQRDLILPVEDGDCIYIKNVVCTCAANLSCIMNENDVEPISLLSIPYVKYDYHCRRPIRPLHTN